jgi:hypothetical protein
MGCGSWSLIFRHPKPDRGLGFWKQEQPLRITWARLQMNRMAEPQPRLPAQENERPHAHGDPGAGSAALLGAMADAASAMARLDQALAGHPLQPAFLHRLRLEAVRRQAAVDGQLIDPWHLAALLEGLRLRGRPPT